MILEDGTGVSHRMVSVFVFARHLGAGVAASYGWQAVAALVAAVFIVRSWWRDEPAHIRNAVLLVGTCLAAPYLMDYDLVFGAFVVVWLLKAEKDFQLSPQHIRGAAGADLAAAVAERTDRKPVRAIDRTAGLSSRIRALDISWCGIFPRPGRRAAGGGSLNARLQIAFFSFPGD